MLEFIDGSKLINFNEVIFTDHRGYITDLALEKYFNVEGNYADKLQVNRLNSRRLSYWTKFVGKAKELLQETGLE